MKQKILYSALIITSFLLFWYSSNLFASDSNISTFDCRVGGYTGTIQQLNIELQSALNRLNNPNLTPKDYEDINRQLELIKQHQIELNIPCQYAQLPNADSGVLNRMLNPEVYVHGYVKQNGKYVAPYKRKYPKKKQ